MKLVFAVDALVPPLTGIGRYAWELASHYNAARDEFDSLRFFFADRWVADPADMIHMHATGVRGRKSILPRAPKSWRQWGLRRTMQGRVFHSPNYFLPESVECGVVTVHDLSVFRYPETHPEARIRHFEKGFASTLARASHLITDSDAIRSEVIDRFGWSPDGISAVPLGVRPAFQPRDARCLAASLAVHGIEPGFYGLCVSTLEPRKRIDRLLAAYLDLPNALRARYPLVLAGSSGWLSDALREQIARGEQQGWLRYLGFVDEAFLPTLYAGARAFLFPSIYEGFGLPVLEAMASGVPVLTSNVSSLPEVVGDAGWLVEPDDHDALRDGIEAVLSDETWRQTAIARGLAIASILTWERCVRGTLDVYRRFA